MEWVLRSPQFHSIFGNLGYVHTNGYHINDDCNETLRAILQNIVTEDQYLHMYRRSINFAQNVQKDLIPLLKHTKDDMSINLIIQILVNLTTPVEALVPLDTASETEAGRHIIFELNNLLTSTKISFTDRHAIKVLVAFLKKNIGDAQTSQLSLDQCTNICNILTFLRNVLSVPEDVNSCHLRYKGSSYSAQNQILWNLFSQSFDKLLIKLMLIPEAQRWAITMVQLISILYKDQHVTTLHKLLKQWLEGSSSENLEDNESNTSPNRGNVDSFPILSMLSASDSTDTGNKRQSSENSNSLSNEMDNASGTEQHDNNSENNQTLLKRRRKSAYIPKRSKRDCTQNNNNTSADSENGNSNLTYEQNETTAKITVSSNKKNVTRSEISDCGNTQVKNQNHKSASSCKRQLPVKKKLHKRTHSVKKRYSSVPLLENKKKIPFKRSKTMVVVKGLASHIPTEDEITVIIKDFTVNFLLKGYNCLVHTLYSQILIDIHFEMDTSLFFWLLTYFLKLSVEMELDYKHLVNVLSYDIVSYLTAEGTYLCEQVELGVKLDGKDLDCMNRRLHLVVTSIREFITTMKVYMNSTRVYDRDIEVLHGVQMKMCESEELRALLVLLIRHFNPKYQSLNYLQDLIVANHILLQFLDSEMKLKAPNDASLIQDHLYQFTTPAVVYQYGLLLENYKENGEFLNDCIFTVMYHISLLGSLELLCQPHILKVLTTIWKSEFPIAKEWLELIEDVMSHFMRTLSNIQSTTEVKTQENDVEVKSIMRSTDDMKKLPSESNAAISEDVVGARTDAKEGWTEEELSSLSWYYMQCNSKPDVISEVVKLFKEDGIIKNKDSIVTALLDQSIINKDEFKSFFKEDSGKDAKALQDIKELIEDDIGRLCEQLVRDNKCQFLAWVQTVLLEACHVKIHLENSIISNKNCQSAAKQPTEVTIYTPQKKKSAVMSPVSYYSLIHHESIPLIPWNCEQAAICKDLRFLKLSHKLGFHMPVDTGKVFIRIPHFWTSDYLYEVAGKISPIDTSKLKFSLSDISQSSVRNSNKTNYNFLTPPIIKKTIFKPSAKIHNAEKQKLFADMLNSTPKPGMPFVNLNKPDWLKMVRKAQEFRIVLDMQRPVLKCRRKLTKKMIIRKMPKNDKNVSVTSVALNKFVPLPNIMTVNQETQRFTINQAKD